MISTKINGFKTPASTNFSWVAVNGFLKTATTVCMYVAVERWMLRLREYLK
jgi:hypothetical protein